MIKRLKLSFPLRLHPLFTLLMLVSVATGYFAELITLFAIVLIHEIGHAVAAKSFGWRIVKIELLPFGGVAETDDRGRSSAYEEMIVALAGPVQNGWMAAFALLMKNWGVWDAAWSDYFIRANVMIALFNLLPIVPLDGGKVLQALASLWLPYYRTLTVCSAAGCMLSVPVVVYALPHSHSGGLNLNLLAIGLFLLVSNGYAYRNASYVFVRFLMNREGRMSRLIEKGTLAQPIVVYRHRKIADIIRLFMRQKYHLVYVMNEKGKIEAVFPEQRLLFVYFHLKRPESAVSDLFMLK